MKLLFDLLATQPNESGKRHGGGRYTEIIFYRMIERGIKFSCFYDSRRWLNPQVANICKLAQIPLYDVKNETIRDIVKNNGINRIYSALTTNLTQLDNCDIYVTIHGLRDLETPFDHIFYKYRHSPKEFLKFTLKKLFASSFRKLRAKQFYDCYISSKIHIATVSNHSKYALYSYFPELRGQYIPVFYSPNTSKKEKFKRNENERYFMLVSGNRWEKNNLRAIMAFDRLLTTKLIDSNIRMKITGTAGNDFKYKLKNSDSFDFLGYVNDDELEQLYANAFVFVYPSLNEGFGYPPLEAMRYGVPVIASPISSISEVCGGDVIYFNPFSVEEIMNRMMMMLDKTLYSKYSEKALLRYSEIKKIQDEDLDKLINYIYQ